MIRKQLNHLLRVERTEDHPMGIHIFKRNKVKVGPKQP